MVNNLDTNQTRVSIILYSFMVLVALINGVARMNLIHSMTAVVNAEDVDV